LGQHWGRRSNTAAVATAARARSPRQGKIIEVRRQAVVEAACAVLAVVGERQRGRTERC
jgi:hypothetical protein